MRILIVCSGNATNFSFEKHQAFVYDQVTAVQRIDSDIQFEYFFVKRKGIAGYLKCRNELIRLLDTKSFDWVHAHFSLSGLLANLQRKVPVIVTFHGSDINNRHTWPISAAVEMLSEKTIYVSEELRRRTLVSSGLKSAVLPCGVDFDIFRGHTMEAARKQLGLSPGRKYVLFSSRFDNTVKNYPLARDAIKLVSDWDVKLLELTNLSREEVALYLSAVDAALMTSFSEGSPQFIKEALACDCPVVTTNVGDVRKWLSDVEGCYISNSSPDDVARDLVKVLRRGKRIEGRRSIQQLDNQEIAKQLIQIYRANTNT